jgi:acylphosphatase
MEGSTIQKRVRIFVTGRVQGVFFRASTVDQAAALGVHGFVRNRIDGRVEIVAEGTPTALASLATWAQKGPPGARVDDIQVKEEAPRGERGFAIRRGDS